MKLKHALLLLFSGLTACFYSQTNDYTAGYIVNPAVSCHSGLKVCTSTGQNPENGGIIYVDWADGTIDTLNYFQAANTSNSCHFFWHDYTTTGIYNAVITVYSTAGGGIVPGNTVIDFTITNLATCEYFIMTTAESNFLSLHYDVVYDVTDANGVTMTIPPVSSYGLSYYFGLDAANAPYTASINNSWLAAHNKIQVTPDFVISDFNSDGSAYNLPQNMQVSCNDTALPTNLSLDYFYAYSFVAPLQSGTLTLKVCNQSCAAMADAALSIAFPAGFTPVTANLSNALFQNDTLYFDEEAITGCRIVNIPVTFPGNTPAGTTVTFSASVSGISEVDFSDNSATATAEVLNSYDPNDKTCNLPALLSPDITETLHYRIQCQNDGNFPALNVVIRDTISTYLDLSTFRVNGSSHPLTTSVDPATREVVFSMYNAQLAPSADDPEGSKGYILYEISEAAGVPLNTTIANTGYIFFDYNPPIVTNTTEHVNAYLGLENPAFAQHILFPNPASDFIQLASGQTADLQIFDLSGKLLLSARGSNGIFVGELAPGLYTVLVRTASGTGTYTISKL